MNLTKQDRRFWIVVALVVAFFAGTFVDPGSDRPEVTPPTTTRTPFGPVLSLGTFSGSPDVVACTDSAERTKAMTIWNYVGTGPYGGLQQMTGDADSGDPQRMYDAHDLASPMISMAVNCDDTALALQIAQGLDGARNTRFAVNDFRYDNSGLSPSGTDYYSWGTGVLGSPPHNLNQPSASGNTIIECELCVAQFMTGPARLLAYFTTIPSGSRSAAINTWISNWVPIIRDHVNHWVMRETWLAPFNASNCTVPGTSFSTYGTSTRGHEQRLARMAADNYVGAFTYCNSADDRDLFIVDVAGLLMLSYARDPSAAPLTGTPGCSSPTTPCGLALEGAYGLKAHQNAGGSAFRSNQSTTALTNLAAGAATGRILDGPGYNDIIAENGWSGTTDASRVPNGGNITCGGANLGYNIAPNPSWDIGHFRRWPETAFIMREVGTLSGVTNEPTDGEMTQFANQMAYGVWNKNQTSPQFSNFENAQGWYRVFYAGRNGFGYSPNNLGNVAFLQGGYGLWARFNSDIRTATTSVKTILEATSGAAQTHRITNFTGPWYDCVRSGTISVDSNTSKDLMKFYAAYVAAGNQTPVASTTTTSTTVPGTYCLTRVEAEQNTVAGAVFGGAVISTDPGASGSGIVGSSVLGSGFTVSVTSPWTATFTAKLVYTSSVGADRTFSPGGLHINSPSTDGTLDFAAASVYTESGGVSVALTAGVPQDITLQVFNTDDGGGMAADYWNFCTSTPPPASTTTTTTSTTTTLVPAGCVSAGRFASTVTVSTGSPFGLTDLNEAVGWTATSTAVQVVTFDFGTTRKLDRAFALFEGRRATNIIAVDTRAGTTGTWTRRPPTQTGYKTFGVNRCFSRSLGGVSARQVRFVLQTPETPNLPVKILEAGMV